MTVNHVAGTNKERELFILLDEEFGDVRRCRTLALREVMFCVR